ncbi:MAG TPA: phenylalanine--tRNA ligase subunit alpha, partial [bacterium]|nr:phenylalanine--tRNA ligase subunit alpha [bacterium]
MKDQLEKLRKDFLEQMASVPDKEALEAMRVAFLGKKGSLTALMKDLKDLSPEMKKEAGQTINQIKSEMESSIDKKFVDFDAVEIQRKIDCQWSDITWPSEPVQGSVHPISMVRAELEELFISMGFEIIDGPEMESEYYNFNALNIPADHPARDAQDTFWLRNGMLLRTQTSPVQIRGMQSRKPPFKFVSPGKVYRNEAVDASHEHTFHQIEGMVVDKGISVANLIYTLKKIVSNIFGHPVEIRLRPSFFPFVEPGFELDFKCQICGGKGCSVCKQTGWVEYLGCGMIHPNVLKNGGIDPEEYQGFAFGGGIERLVMM